jgi:hypothetical protein
MTTKAYGAYAGDKPREPEEAYDRMQTSDVKYRFVIDNASLVN